MKKKSTLVMESYKLEPWLKKLVRRAAAKLHRSPSKHHRIVMESNAKRVLKEEE